MKDVIENLDSAMQMFKAGKPPAGFVPIPNSKHGGYHKRTADGWQTWYPGDAKPKDVGPDHTKTIREMALTSRTNKRGTVNSKVQLLPLRYRVAESIANKHPDLVNHIFHEGIMAANDREPGQYINHPDDGGDVFHVSRGHRITIEKLKPEPHDPTPHAVHHFFSDPHDESRRVGNRIGHEVFHYANEDDAKDAAQAIADGVNKHPSPVGNSGKRKGAEPGLSASKNH